MAKQDIKALLLGMSDEEISSIDEELRQERSKRNRSKLAENNQKKIITDFKNPEVIPFDRRSVYKVYNTHTDTEVLMSGRLIDSLIAGNDDDYRRFELKRTNGFFRTNDGKEISFVKFEVN